MNALHTCSVLQLADQSQLQNTGRRNKNESSQIFTDY